MTKYLSNRQRNLKVGITSYTENQQVLEVIGKVGIGTTNATERLDVDGTIKISGGISVGGTTGTSGQVLKSTGTGLEWGSGGSGGNWIKKTTTYTSSSGDQIIADTSGGDFTINLPSSPSTGNYVSFADGDDWSTNNLTIGRNGSTIEGGVENFILDIKGIIVDFIYDGTTWEVYANVGSKGDELWIQTSAGIHTLSSVGIGTTNPQEKLHVSGNFLLDNVVSGSLRVAISTTSPTGIHSGLSTSTYRSVEYTIQATEGTNYHATKILALHDGSTVDSTEYATIYNNTSVSTFTLDVSGGNIRLLATPASASTTNFVVNFVATKL